MNTKTLSLIISNVLSMKPHSKEQLLAYGQSQHFAFNDLDSSLTTSPSINIARYYDELEDAKPYTVDDTERLLAFTTPEIAQAVITMIQ
jgi:hypothetical protein